MIFVRSVREVEASHIHAGSQQLLQHGHRPRRRSQSAHDLRLGFYNHLHSLSWKKALDDDEMILLLPTREKPEKIVMEVTPRIVNKDDRRR